MSTTRFAENPLLTPANVKPSQPELRVSAVINAGCVRMDDEILLMLRVDERFASADEQAEEELIAPVLDPEDAKGGLRAMRVRREDPDVQEINGQTFRYRGRVFRTVISHLRLAHSMDGRHFTVQEQPAIFPSLPEEEYGLEDPRIVQLDGLYYITCGAVSRDGSVTVLACTREFQRYERRGSIFPAGSGGAVIYPEELGGRYFCFNASPSREEIWALDSSDLLHWGNPRVVTVRRPGAWDEAGISPGAVPIRTDEGWLQIYNGVDRRQRRCLGLLLTDLQQPHRVLSRSDEPFLVPEQDYERKGDTQAVVTCGALHSPDRRVFIYYGAGDECTCGVETSIEAMLASVGR